MKIVYEEGKVTFTQAWKDYWKGFFDFNGVSTRAGFWWNTLFYIVIIVAISIINLISLEHLGTLALALNVVIKMIKPIMLISILAAISRRLKDTGMCYFVIVPLLAIYVAIWYFIRIFMLFRIIGLIWCIIMAIILCLPTGQFGTRKTLDEIKQEASLRQAWKNYWKLAFNYRGKASRSEFWLEAFCYFGITYLEGYLLSIIRQFAMMFGDVHILMGIVIIDYVLLCVLTIPLLALAMRRFRDLGVHPILAIIMLICYSILFLITLFLKMSIVKYIVGIYNLIVIILFCFPTGTFNRNTLK